MRETLRFLASPVRGYQAAVYVLALSAFFSSALALIRDRLFAHSFGAGIELDLYYAAFRIPDFLFVLIGSLVSVYVLIPELSRRDTREQRNYLDSIVVGFSALTIILSAVAFLLAPTILAWIFPHFEREGVLPVLVGLTRIILLQPVLLGFSNILAAITQLKERYTLYALSPILYNLGIIGGLILLYPLFGLYGLAWGVVLGAFLHMGVQLPAIVRDGFFRPVPRLHSVRALIATAALSMPRSLALSMQQITNIGLTALAATLSSGSIAVFTLAFNLMSVPLSIIGASYSVAAFPTLATALSEGRTREFIEHVATAARYILFWALPAAGLIIVLRAHLVRTVLGSGAFDWTDTRLTAAVFALLTVSLAAQAITLLLARAYYAAGRTFVPFTIAALSTISTLFLASGFIGVFHDAALLLFLERLLRIEEVPGSAVVVLPIAFTFVSLLSALLLAAHFEWRYGGFFARIRTSLSHASLACMGAMLGAYGALVLVGPLDLSSTLLTVFARGLVGGIAGISASALVYAVLMNQEFAETVATVRGRFWRAPLRSAPIVSAEEIGPSSPQ